MVAQTFQPTLEPWPGVLKQSPHKYIPIWPTYTFRGTRIYLQLLKCLFPKGKSSLTTMVLCPVGSSPLSRRTDTQFAPAPWRACVHIYLLWLIYVLLTLLGGHNQWTAPMGRGYFIVVFSQWALKMWVHYIHCWLKMNDRMPSTGGSRPLAIPTNKCGHGFSLEMWC